MRIPAPAALMAALVVATCGCGGQEDAGARLIPGGADPSETRVIDEWSATLRRGDIEGAARFFAIPSVAQNGPILVRIDGLGDARRFNASLPCGAILTRAEP